MKTTKEVLDFINKNSYFDAPADFSAAAEEIVGVLNGNEDILFAAGSKSINQHKNGGSYIICQKATVVALTNERLIYAGKSSAPFARNLIVNSVEIDQIANVNKTKQAFGSSYILITARDIEFLFFASKNIVDTMYQDFMSIIKSAKEPKPTVASAGSAADELKKFKELLDIGAITQEEFDAKKKQLLGL